MLSASPGLAPPDWRGNLLGLGLAALLALPLLLTPVDASAWLLLYAGFALVLGSPATRARPALAFALCLVLAVHHSAAVVDAWAFPLPGSEADAAVFAQRAMRLAMGYDQLEWTLGSGFFANLLAALYMVLGNSDLLGNGIAVLAFTVALVLFARFLDLLEVPDQQQPWLVLGFGLLPATVIYTSITLREGMELGLLVGAVYGGVRALTGPRRALAAGLAVVAGVALGWLHAVLMLYAAVLVLLFLAWPLGARSELRWRAGALAMLALLGIGLATFIGTLDIPRGDDVFALLARDVPEQVARYRAGVDAGEPRTAFGVDLDVSGVLAFAGSFARVYAHYLLAPFPWQVTEARDAYAAAESLLRLVLLVFAGVAVWRARGSARRLQLLLLAVYLTLTALWCIGTTNYGQALRHHVTTNWLLVLAGGPALVTAVEVAWRRWVPRRAG